MAASESLENSVDYEGTPQNGHVRMAVVVMLSLFSVVGVVGNAIAFYIFFSRKSASTSITFILALAANRLCHGNIDDLNPSGEANGGVAASNNDAQIDMGDLQNHRSCYEASADNNCIQSSVLGGIASRESRGGRLLVSTGGYGDFGNAWGIMQCDLRYSGLNCKACPWDSCCHIEMLTSQTLVPFINQIRNKFPGWSQSQALQGGIAAYNSGPSTINSWPPDGATTGRDYSNDVVARAKYLKSHGWN